MESNSNVSLGMHVYSMGRNSFLDVIVSPCTNTHLQPVGVFKLLITYIHLSQIGTWSEHTTLVMCLVLSTTLAGRVVAEDATGVLTL